MFHQMGFLVDHSSLIAHILRMAALLFALLKCFLSQVISLKYVGFLSSFNSHSYEDDAAASASASSTVSCQMIRDNLILTTFENITDMLPESSDRCAVCLDQLMMQDKVRMLRNCCHVFHGHCIDRWIDHDHLKTCPLCRTPLFASSQSQNSSWVRSEPSWAVERLLYLFGDDLLM